MENGFEVCLTLCNPILTRSVHRHWQLRQHAASSRRRLT